MQNIFEKKVTLSELPSLAEAMAPELLKVSPFFLALDGEMGAGKTTFTGHLLRTFGLPKEFPVTSPTFTYLNQYSIRSETYFHIDMYRGDSCPFRTSEELFGGTTPRGAIVEWPSKAQEFMSFTHLLKIDIANERERFFRFFSC